MSGQGVATAGKGFTLFISNEDTDDIIKIDSGLENTRGFRSIDWCCYWNMKTWKKKKAHFLVLS